MIRDHWFRLTNNINKVLRVVVNRNRAQFGQHVVFAFRALLNLNPGLKIEMVMPEDETELLSAQKKAMYTSLLEFIFRNN